MQSFAKDLSRVRTRRQSGSVAMLGALWLMIAVICLATIDIANMFWQKRELQKIADLAALAGAVLPLDKACSSATTANTKKIAAANGMQVDDEFEAKFGLWKPDSKKSIDQYFSDGNQADSNACNVKIRRNVAYLFLFPSGGSKSRLVSAEATAIVASKPMATVLIRSTLASVDGGVLNALLTSLLGTNVNLNAVSWQGIAKLNVNLLKTFDSLLKINANIGGYEELLKSNIRLADLVNSMINAVEPGNFLSADLVGLKELSLLNFGNLQVKLGDLIKLENTNPGSALNLGVNALELIQGALQVAGKDHALELNSGILGLLKIKMKIIEPAQMAIIGNPFDNNVKIEARTAQVRLWVALSTASSPIGSVLNTVLGLVVDLLKLVLSLVVNIEVLPEFRNLNQLNLDVLVDVARGYARIDSADCTDAQHRVDLTVEKALVDVYVGQLAGGDINQRELQAFGSSIPQVKPLTIIDIGSRVCVVLGLICGPRTEGSQGNIKLGGHLKLAADTKSVSYVNSVGKKNINDFSEVKELVDERIYHKVPFSNVKNISDLLQGGNLIEINIGAGVSDSQKFSLVDSLLKNVLKPVLSILDPLAPFLDGLLNALGIHLNEIEVAPYLQCRSSSELVY
ncbi:pilus assembly protein TadG-related protein [Comamonas thiooxydans]|uniref:TadG family pilus assembly protein n=1 Tax=Comamonas thiooxydans TaxID=363952 RepID=UPI000A2DA087|nr:TadG family pilus assembly protein [Comamonas thiooxydans]BDR11701.1 pilus assembly protein TadG-related protein [Comamonas thiooxydans]